MEIYQQNTISRSEFITILDQLESNLLQAILSKVDSFEYFFEKNILVNYGDEISFEDRSLQEYLAACEMAKWRDQKKVSDLVVVKELREINPSWVNTLSYYLDLNNSFFEYAIESYPDLVLRSNVASLLPDQKTKIFQKILTDYQEKKVKIDFKIAKRIAQLYSDELKGGIEKYMVDSAHFVQKGNIALLVGLISLPGYKQWLIDCINGDNQKGPLQERALYSLGKLGDVSVIEQTQKALSHPDVPVRQAFLDMCGELNPEGSISYFLDAINKSTEENNVAEKWLAEIQEKEALLKVLERIISDRQVLEKLAETSSREEYLAKIFEHIEAVYDESIQDLLTQLVFALLNIHRHDSVMMHSIAALLKKKAPDIWKDILVKALQDEKLKKYLFIFSTVFSYFITDKNLHEFREKIREMDRRDWIIDRLVYRIKENKEYPAYSIIEEKARELLPEYYQQIDAFQKQQKARITPEERRFLQWRKVFDQTPLQYDNNRFGLFYQCLNDFDESFELAGFAVKKMKTIIKSILSQIDPTTFRVTIKEWGDSGEIKKFSETWGQALYAKALKLNFELNAGFSERKRLISFLRVSHSGEEKLLENILDALGQLQPDEVETIKGFLQEKVYTAIHTYIQIIKKKRLDGCVDLLKGFINDEKIEYYCKTECLEVIEELMHDKNYLKSIFQDDALDECIQKRAAYLLIKKHQNEKAFKWQVEQLKQGLRPDDWHWSDTSDWLVQVKIANAITLYLELLETSYDLPLEQKEYASWLRQVAIGGLKFQKSREAVKALRGFIDENKDKKEGVNFLEYAFEDIQTEYLLFKGKPVSIQDAVIRYNEINRKVSQRIPDETALFNTIAEVFETQIRHAIEEEGGYKNFYRDSNFEQPKKETDVQQLFRIWRPYFQTSGIHMAQEVETGRGPVDYTFNYGFTPKIQDCHLEIKLSTHNCVPEGFEPQLETYIVADSADAGIFLVVRVAGESGPIPDDIKWIEWQEKITKSCEQLGKQKGIPIKPIFIDALKKPSASKIKNFTPNK